MFKGVLVIVFLGPLHYDKNNKKNCDLNKI